MSGVHVCGTECQRLIARCFELDLILFDRSTAVVLRIHTAGYRSRSSMDRAVVSEAANLSSNLSGSTSFTFQFCLALGESRTP